MKPDQLADAAAVGELALDGAVRPVACVTADNGADLREQTVKAHLGSRVPYDLARLAVKRVDSFPMTPTGKISKAQLMEKIMP